MNDLNLLLSIIVNIMIISTPIYSFVKYFIIYTDFLSGKEIEVGGLSIIFVETKRWKSFKKVAPKFHDSVVGRNE